VRASRNLPHANQDTNGSIEAYHGLIKRRYLGAFKRLSGRRIDWLVHTLTGSVTNYYWYMQMMKNAGFIKNCKIEELIESSFEKARQIPDEYVIYDEDLTQGFIKVRSMSSETIFYKVYGPNLEWACCTCKKAEMGDICKHQLKIMLLKDKSTSNVKEQCLELYQGSLSRVCTSIHTFSGEDNDDTMLVQEGSSSTILTLEEDQRNFDKEINHLKELVGNDPILLKAATTHLKKVNRSLKCKQGVSNECYKFATSNDGFGNSVKRSKPFFERFARSSKSVEKPSFDRPQKAIRKSMQEKLDIAAKESEQD
jgi:hypothetical protein